MNVRDSADRVAEGAQWLTLSLGADSRPMNRLCLRSPVPANRDFFPGKRQYTLHGKEGSEAPQKSKVPLVGIDYDKDL